MTHTLAFDPALGMTDAQLLQYLADRHGIQRSRSWLRTARKDGRAPKFWRDGLIAKTDQNDADVFVDNMKAKKFASTIEEQMR